MLRKSANGNSPEAFSLIERYASRESSSCADDVATTIKENRKMTGTCHDRRESRDFTSKRLLMAWQNKIKSFHQQFQMLDEAESAQMTQCATKLFLQII